MVPDFNNTVVCTLKLIESIGLISSVVTSIKKKKENVVMKEAKAPSE